MMGTRALFAATAAFCLASCTTTSSPNTGDDFENAARAYDVPVDLLKAIAYVETRWQPVVGEAGEFERPSGAGVFALWGDNLAHGAAASGLTETAVRTDTAANIEAAAARLAELAAEQGVTGDDLMAWQPVIAGFAQIEDEEARAGYVSDVLGVLATGAETVAEDGRKMTLLAHADMLVPQVTTIAGSSVDFGSAISRPSPNFNSRNGSAVSLVVIHDCEGSYSGCWGYLRTTAAQASAHYVVNESGSEVTQLVRESNRAWHVAANYQCANAGNAQCGKNGTSTNTFSVGIEHAGFASQASWSNGIIEKSAALTCDITKRHGVIRDRNHIVSHGQLQPYNRNDPGPNWPWSHYIDRVREICGDTGGGGGGGGNPTQAIIVDSNNANNNQAVAKIELTGTWTASTSNAGYYGSGYWTANTAQSSAPATFYFYLPAAGTKTIDGWWTTGTNRATATPFIAFNASGTEVGRKLVNQQTGGSQWVALGTWNFSAGWNKVVVSRWTNSGSVVIADAIRVR
ncbi:MAG TPA: N-acetylmuramoyl-L-alanine amidase [Kofleriaceae bacterium]|nr:N-acetylmuramoyl-L-alanine amidase [Kofleriaceae bacterium]